MRPYPLPAPMREGLTTCTSTRAWRETKRTELGEARQTQPPSCSESTHRSGHRQVRSSKVSGAPTQNVRRVHAKCQARPCKVSGASMQSVRHVHTKCQARSYKVSGAEIFGTVAMLARAWTNALTANKKTVKGLPKRRNHVSLRPQCDGRLTFIVAGAYIHKGRADCLMVPPAFARTNSHGAFV